MPNRIIREAILSSERVAQLAWPEEVFYRRLMSIVDDYGRTEANPQLLRAKCYPLQTDAVRVTDISRWMAACQKAGLILCYDAQGKQYLELSNFGQQQRSASKCPDPLSSDSTCNQLIANAHLGVSVVEDVFEDDKKPARKRAAADAVLFPGVSENVIRDYKALRHAKRAPITELSIAAIAREAQKAGLSLEQALIECCECTWQTFRADWYFERKNGRGKQGDRATSGMVL